MIKEPDDGDSDLDGVLRSIANDVYESSEGLVSGQSLQLDAEDICPLYHSMTQITERYQSPELVGHGGMKEVYRAYDAKMTRHVALAKPLAKHSKDRFDAFLREAHLTARLDHPGIIEVFNMGIDDQQRPFFTMEFKKGRSLADLILEVRENRVERQYHLRGRLEIFARICEAIAYAHSQRVLHLDIKPSNIQIGEFGEVLVCDWGLGVVMPDDDVTDNSTALLDPDLYGPLSIHARGTPAYMAPERTDSRQPRMPQMDVYSLGCVLYELITGQKYSPAHRQEKIVPGLSAIVKKAVAESVEHRYESVAELCDDLSLFLSDYSTSVEKRNPFREGALFWKRHREACMVVLGACVLFAGFLSTFIYQLSAKEQVAVVAREQAEVAEEEAKGLLAKYQLKFSESERLLTELRVSHKRLEKLQHNAQKFFAVQGSPKIVQQSINHFRLQVDAENVTADSRALEYLCWWYLVDQDFEAAHELADVEHGIGIPVHLREIAESFAPLVNANGYLKTKDMLALLDRVASRHLLVERILVHDLQNPRSMRDRVRLIRHSISLFNGGQKIVLKYNRKTRRLRLSGPVKNLNFGFDLDANTKFYANFLGSLDPLSIDLRGSQVKLDQLLGLRPVEIDVRNTPISNLSPLWKLGKEFRTLQQLTVEEGQFSKEQLDKVPSWITVNIAPKEVEKREGEH